MIIFFLFAHLYSVYAGDVGAQTGDLNCTTNTGATSTWLFNAARCNNKQDTAACETIFGPTMSPPIAAGGKGQRPKKCINGAGTDTNPPDANQPFAISTCAKTCGYCCLTPEFKCDNKPRPRIPCNTVTNEMCDSTTWRQIIAEDCPNTCGFCLDGGCIDVAPNCGLNGGSVCVTIGLEQFVQENCKRTCGLCPPSGATTVAPRVATTQPPSPCGDTNTNCAQWVRNGFCSNSFYTLLQRRQFCGQSCGFC